MKTMLRFTLFVAILASCTAARAQVHEAWSQRYDGPAHESDLPVALAIHSSGDIFVLAQSANHTNYDIFVARYPAAGGPPVWSKRINPGNRDDQAHDLEIDSAGNLLVLGTSTNAGAIPFLNLMKLSPADGTLLWSGPATLGLVAYSMAVDRSDDVVIIGQRDSKGYTAKYAGATGALLWEKVSPGEGGRRIAVDASGAVAVNAASPTGILTTKYSGTGAVLWEKPFSGQGAPDIAMDAVGNVYVAGVFDNGGDVDFDFLTVKYAASNGAILWEKRYAGPGESNDQPIALKVDAAGDVVVTGNSNVPGLKAGLDFVTLKYASASGETLWENRFNGPAEENDSVNSLTLDAAGNPIVFGGATVIGDEEAPRTALYTAKYASDGGLLWEAFYQKSVLAGDFISPPQQRVVAIPGGGAAVLGTVFTGVLSPDLLLIKYAEDTVPPSTDAVVAVVGAPVPGQPAGTIYSALGAPTLGAFGGKLRGGGSPSVGAVFAANGAVLLKEGAPAPGLPGAVIAKVGEPSGQAAVVMLKPGVGGVTVNNDGVLYGALGTANPVVVLREGPQSNGWFIKSFGAIDGHGSRICFLATAQLGSVELRRALLSAALGGELRLLAVEHGLRLDPQGFRPYSTFASLVGLQGTLAEGRWRAGDTQFGFRVTFPPGTLGTQGLVVATEGAEESWPSITINPETYANFGFPAFGPGTIAVPGTLRVGRNGVTKADSAAIFRGVGPTVETLAQSNHPAPDPAGQTFAGRVFGKLGEVAAGSGGRLVFDAGLVGPGVTSANNKGLWQTVADSVRQVVQTGTPAPGGGMWAAFTSYVLPESPVRGPFFTATLAVNPAAGVTQASKFGLWAADSTGTLRLLLRTGASFDLQGVPKTVKSFRALEAASGSVGAARGYTSDGQAVAALITFTDDTVALVRLTVP